MSEAEYLETLQLDRVLQDEYLSELRADIEEYLKVVTGRTFCLMQ